MSSERLVKLGTYANEFQAHNACNQLLAHGITAFVEGASAQTTLSYIGSALGGVKLMVPQSSIDSAREILDAEQIDGGPWQCGHCYSEVDAGFDVCWKCGSHREDAALLTEPDVAPESDDAQVDFSAPTRELPPERGSLGESPYSPPAAALASPGVPRFNPDGELMKTVEEELSTAWRVCIIGAALVPGVMQVVSLFLQFRALARHSPLPSALESKFYGLLFLNVLIIAVVVLFFAVPLYR